MEGRQPQRAARAGLAACLLAAAALASCTSAPTPTPTVTPAAPASVLRAIHATVTAKTAAFTERITLTSGLASFLGASVPTLTGSGQVDFANNRAQWTLSMPRLFRGPLQVIAIGGATYFTVPLYNGPNSITHWIELSSPSDYHDADSLPLVRDLVVLTNPLRDVNLAASEHQDASTTSTTHRASAGAQLVDDTTGACSRLEIVHGNIDPNKVADVMSVGVTAEEGALSAWRKNRITTDGGEAGLCSVRLTVENATFNGFDLTVTLVTPGVPVSIAAPRLESLLVFGSTYHVTFPGCFNGTWVAPITTAPPFLPRGEGTSIFAPWIASGKVSLKIKSDGGSGPGHVNESSVVVDAVFTSEQTVELPPVTDKSVPIILTKPISLDFKMTAEGTVSSTLTSGGGSLTALTEGHIVGVATGGFGTQGLSSNEPTAFDEAATWQCAAQPWKLTMSTGRFGVLNFKYSAAATLPQLIGPPAEFTVSQNWRESLAPSTPTPAPSPTPSPNPTGPIGTSLTASNGMAVDVLSLSAAKYSSTSLLTPRPGTNLVAANVKACVPASARPGQLFVASPVAFGVTMSRGATASYVFGAVDNQLQPNALAPGACSQGLVGFVVPADDVPAKVTFSNSVTGEVLTWKVP